MMVIFCTGAEWVCFAATKGVADLVVGHDLFSLVGEDGVLLLVARDDHLDALLQVGLSHALAARRTARRAASLTMLASSAPDAPEAIRARR